MKNIYKILFVGLVAALLWSCEKNDDFATANNVTAPTLKSSKDNVVLLQAQDASEAVTFTYTNATYSINVVPTYELEFAVAGTNFKSSKKLGVDSNKKIVTVKDLNTLVSSLAPQDVATKYDVRLNSILGNNVVSSQPIAVTITTYKPNPDNVYPKIYVPGGYAGASGYTSWTPSNWQSPALFSPKKDDVYYGFVYMNFASADDSKFKFTYAEEAWGNNKGDTAENPNSYSTLAKDGKDITIPNGVGTYYIKVDWAGNTYSMKRMDMGIIGDATPQGWDSDVKLTFNKTTHKFETTMLLQGGKAFKFRNDSSWGVKIQPTGKTDQELASGAEFATYVSSEGTVSDDANYKVATTGTYKIELDLHNAANYTIKVTKQ